MKTRIALIEDHPEYRKALEKIVEEQDGIVISMSFGTAEDALREFDGRSENQRPDVVLLDLGLPGMGGLESIPLILESLPLAKVVVLSQSGKEDDVLRAFSLGARGYLLKSARASEITSAIKSVASGGVSIDCQVAGYIVESLAKKEEGGEDFESPLTSRERQVLERIADGKLRKEIALDLGISETTVVYHINNVYEKLQVHNAPSAVAKAFGLGILPS